MDMKNKGAIFALLLAMASLVGCETTSGYVTCELDKEVTSKNICSGASGASTANSTSCVVRSHPHCVEHVCLSYYSRTPVCTRVCATNADCVLDGTAGTCWEFAAKVGTTPAERYCVPPDSFYEGLTGG